MELLADPNMQSMMLRAFVICLVLTGIHGYLGFHVLARKVIFVDLAMAQIAALGKIYALFIGFPEASMYTYFFSLGATLIGAYVFAITRMKSGRVPHEAIIGIIYACSSAVAILLLAGSPSGGSQIKEMLVGNILSIQWGTIWKTVAIYGAIGVFHWIFRHKFFKISLHYQQASDEGMHIRFWDFLFYVSFGVVITSSVDIAGVLLVFSFLVIPATIGILFVDGTASRIWVGWGVGTVVSALGVLFSFEADQPSGPAVVATFAMVLILCGIVYYIQVRENKLRAAGNVAAGTIFFALLLLGTWKLKDLTAHQHRQQEQSVTQELSRALKQGERTRRMDALSHLIEHPDPDLLPAVIEILNNTKSSNVFERAIKATAAHRSPDALDALRKATRRDLADPFMLYELATDAMAEDEPARVQVLISVLEMGIDREEGLMGVNKALNELRSITGKEFGYNVFGNRKEKKQALAKWREYWRTSGDQLKWNAQSGQFTAKK